MAGERKGKTYEVIVKTALEELVRRRKLKGKVFWNQAPKGMSIEPDLTVGRSVDRPEFVFLVTHSGAAGNSHMKFWRNMGELVEAKTCLATIPKVYSIAFDAVIKDDLKRLQGAAFDGQLIVGDTAYGPLLEKWVDTYNNDVRAVGDDKVEVLRTALRGHNRAAALFNHLVSDLAKLIGQTRPQLDQLWEMQRRRPKAVAPAARITGLRRGTGKLLLFDSLGYLTADGKVSSACPRALIQSLSRLGLVTRSIGGARVTDTEVLWVLRNLDRGSLESVFKLREIPRVREWIEALQSLEALEPQLQFVAYKWTRLTTLDGLFQALNECHAEPNAIATALIPKHSRRVWLFHLLIEWIKLSGSSRTSYGLNALLRDLAILADQPSHRARIRKLLGRAPEWSAKRTIELGLTDWHSVPSKQRFVLTDDCLARVADALAMRLAPLAPPDPRADVHRITEAIIQTNLEAKLLPYRDLDPTSILIQRALELAGLTLVDSPATRSCFAQAAHVGDESFDPRSGGTSVAFCNSTLLNWQSAHDGHANDKKKELCGRAVALRYTWDAAKRGFVARHGVKRMILVVDGTWKRSDLEALVRAGWDRVFYPDEMAQLVKAIV